MMGLRFAIAGLALLGSNQASAQDREPPPVLEALFACQSIEMAEERHTCLADRTRDLETAVQSGDMLVVQRRVVTEAQRQSFGNPMAMASGLASLFSRQNREPETVIEEDGVEVVRDASGEIESLNNMAVDRVDTDRVGSLLVYLENGQVWRQTDNERVRRPSRDDAGVTASISRGAFSSHWMTISSSNKRFRAERVR